MSRGPWKARRAGRACVVCVGRFRGRRAACPDCTRLLARIAEAHRGESGHHLPAAGQADRVARLAAIAAAGKPLFAGPRPRVVPSKED